MYTSAIKTGMRYLAASIVIAAAAAVYGLFSHGVYSYFMTYAFAIPLLAGALPHLLAVLKSACGQTCGSLYEKICGAKDAQLALVVTLTAGSLLKGVLDIYGTTNRLLLVYPAAAAAILAAAAAAAIKNRKIKSLQ